MGEEKDKEIALIAIHEVYERALHLSCKGGKDQSRMILY